MRHWLLVALMGLGLPALAAASEGLDRTYTVTVRLTQLVGLRLHPVHLHCEEGGDNRTPSTVIQAGATQVVQQDRWTSTGQAPVRCTANQQALTVPAPRGQRQVTGRLELNDAPAQVWVSIVHD